MGGATRTPLSGADFVAINIGNLQLTPAADHHSTLSRKGSTKGGGGGEGERKEAASGGGAAANSDAGGPAASERYGVHVHVEGGQEASKLSHASTPTAGRGRRVGRRSSPWLDPRRVLLVFATVSSMGTLILLYFTLSMGAMTSGDAND